MSCGRGEVRLQARRAARPSAAQSSLVGPAKESARHKKGSGVVMSFSLSIPVM